MGMSAWPLFVYVIQLVLRLVVLTHVLSFFQSIGLYIIAVDRDRGDLNDLAKVLFVQPFSSVGPTAAHLREISCIQVTDRRVYFTWDDARRRLDIPLFKDEKPGLDLLSPKDSASSTVEELDEQRDQMVLEFGRHYRTLIRVVAIS
jgi:hypothetical protein